MNAAPTIEVDLVAPPEPELVPVRRGRLLVAFAVVAAVAGVLGGLAALNARRAAPPEPGRTYSVQLVTDGPVDYAAVDGRRVPVGPTEHEATVVAVVTVRATPAGPASCEIIVDGASVYKAEAGPDQTVTCVWAAGLSAG